MDKARGKRNSSLGQSQALEALPGLYEMDGVAGDTADMMLLTCSSGRCFAGIGN